MKKFILLLFIFNSLHAVSQITVTVGSDDGVNGSYDYPCPIQDFYYSSRAQYLYSAAELNAAGLTAGAFINEIGWIVDSAIIAGHLSENYTISLLNTNVTSLNLNMWELGPVTAYGPQNYSYTSGYAGNVMFPTIPFLYTGGNLIVEVCGGITAGSFTDNPSCHWSMGLPFIASHQWRQDVVDGCGNPATANVADSAYRPVLVVTYIPVNTNYPTIEGDVYYDLNQNGVHDGGENGIANKLVSIGPQGYYGFTNTTGHYAVYLDTGNYIVSHAPVVPWVLTSSPDTFSVSIPPNSLNNDFGIWAPDSLVEYIQLVGYVTGIMRCNQPGLSSLSIINSGLYPENGTVTLIHSANLPFNTGTSTQGFTLSGDTVSWSYSNLLPGQNMSYQGNFQNGSAGDTVTFTYIDSVFDASWNFKHVYSNDFTFVVTCSYDPNDKAVDPPGETAAHYTLMNEELQYTIRFQNSGNDTAFSVMILDTLDANLDISTLQVLTSSHPVSLQVTAGGAMQFTFPNILLPDSIVDEPGSHGYVVYKIQPHTGLGEQTMIYNTAHIIFDFNPAIVTNTTYNNMVSQIPTGVSENSLSSSGYIYPNPVTDQAWVILHNRAQEKHMLCVYNSLGEKLLSENFAGSQYLLKEKLHAGIYFVTVSDADGKMIFTSRLVKE